MDEKISKSMPHPGVYSHTLAGADSRRPALRQSPECYRESSITRKHDRSPVVLSHPQQTMQEGDALL